MNYIITTQYLQELQIKLASNLKNEEERERTEYYIKQIQIVLDIIDKFKEE